MPRSYAPPVELTPGFDAAIDAHYGRKTPAPWTVIVQARRGPTQPDTGKALDRFEIAQSTGVSGLRDDAVQQAQARGFAKVAVERMTTAREIVLLADPNVAWQIEVYREGALQSASPYSAIYETKVPLLFLPRNTPIGTVKLRAVNAAAAVGFRDIDVLGVTAKGVIELIAKELRDPPLIPADPNASVFEPNKTTVWRDLDGARHETEDAAIMANVRAELERWAAKLAPGPTLIDDLQRGARTLIPLLFHGLHPAQREELLGELQRRYAQDEREGDE